MAKLERKTKVENHEINLDTGDVNRISLEAWSTSLSNSFVKASSLVEQIQSAQVNLVDETTLNVIAHALVPFNEKGRNLLTQICLYQTTFSTEDIDEAWDEAKRKSKAKNANAFIRLCKAKGLEAKLKEDVWEYKLKEPGKPPYIVTDDLSEKEVDDIGLWGFIEKNNCYYFADYDMSSGICTLEQRSNFVLHILFHINRGKQNKRVIEMVNNRGRKVTTDIETKQLTSFQGFKELTEGSGNFTFKGSQADLMKIKTKLFELEKPSSEIEMLGWDSDSNFFAFSNGLFDSKFHPVDEHGIVTLNNVNYFIPYHPKTNKRFHINEKLFSFKEGKVEFNEWADLYCKAFGDTGKVALLFSIATLFSDHIFAVRRNFPMLFLYGEGGSGKSRVGTYAQYLWGEPQPPLKLSDRANTDKARIRKMAQYINAMALFEEFINELEMNIIKTITGIYDRFGYERSNLNSMYGTETVPINSSAFITGNSYPNDDPLMQRIILIDYNKNVRDEATVEAYNRLTQINREGITHLTGWLLQYRSSFIDKYEYEFDQRFAEFKKDCAEKKIIVPDRMCENYSVILATYAILKQASVGLPFDYKSLKSFLFDTIRAQADKRDVGSVTQRFWDIVQQLASEAGPGGKPVLKEGKEYRLNGNTLVIRWTEVHGLYLEKHQRLYRSPGLGKSTMLQKLTDSGHLIQSKSSWMDGKVAHSHVFQYDKLNIDLSEPVAYWRELEARFTRKSEESEESNVIEQNTVKVENPPNNNGSDDLPF